MRSQGFIYAVLAGIIVSGCASAPAPTQVSKSTVAPADPEAEARWQLFKKQEQRLYLLDQQKFNSVSCKLDVTTLDNLMQMMRNAMAPAADKVSMKDTLDDYSLSFSPVTLLSINDPTLQISLKPGATIPDPAKFDDGMKKINSSFRSLVGGVDTELTAVFSLLEGAKQADYDIVYINETADGFKLSTMDRKSGALVTTELAGRSLTTQVGVGTANSMTSVTEYDAMPSGKLLIKAVTVDMNQAGVVIHVRLVPSFQKLGELEFPRHVSVKGTIDALQTSHQDVTMEIDLSGCALH